ncbi:YhbY family RNA-binding protein [Methanobacterium alkalithermotolerans]|uniref:YhbY family RNA-binding protein n=1 Tax=Methanobacterium alkalithermotolerans TaxID=2731220 RepID=A0A8T8K521_9EURY|nr:YhbY family RNA-binding protein [Methanobacterium alkalithermotolerans]QUH23614.1 YhbY family RNA-binding protein [Methanobacterium alkalithermotolerans]
MRKSKKGEIRLSLTLSKKELMNRSLSALTINIGKAGINDNVIEEIKRQLKAKEMVKLKFAKNISSEKENYITQIVEKSNSKLIDLRGNVAVIFKKKR